MIKENAISDYDRFIELDGSTTYFLESFRNERLYVRLEGQTEVGKSGQTLINRSVKLYFDDVDYPILYCESELVKENMSEREYRQISEAILPIGKVFSLNITENVVKRDFEIIRSDSSLVRRKLNIKGVMPVYGKTYGLWAGTRLIARICEYFSKESLKRIR